MTPTKNPMIKTTGAVSLDPNGKPFLSGVHKQLIAQCFVNAVVLTRKKEHEYEDAHDLLTALMVHVSQEFACVYANFPVSDMLKHINATAARKP